MISGSSSFQEIEKYIRSGRIDLAREALSKIRIHRHPRELRKQIAQWFMRVGWPEKGAKILHVFVRGGPRRPACALPSEMAEYAACLIRLGAIDEGLQLLEQDAVQKLPAALLYRTYALTKKWDYCGSITLLKKFLKLQGINDYQKMIAKINLVDALVYERRTNEVPNFLDEIVEETEKNQLWRLHSNALQIAAVAAFLNGNHQLAESYLRKARSHGCLPETLYVEKWRAVARYFESPNSREKVDHLVSIRQKAQLENQWEVVRDCDRFLALGSGDLVLLLRVYVGTPYQAYRERLLHDYAKPFSIPEVYTWELLGGNPVFHWELDQKPSSRNDGGGTKNRFLISKLIRALTRDFYRPQRFCEIHALIQPGTLYHPLYTSRSLHEIVRRARQWMSDRKIPVTIQEISSAFRLSGVGPVEIQLRTVPEYTFEKKPWEIMERDFGTELFQVHDLVKRVGLPERTVRRLLKGGKEEGVIEQIGRGSATRYRICKKVSNSRR